MASSAVMHAVKRARVARVARLPTLWTTASAAPFSATAAAAPAAAAAAPIPVVPSSKLVATFVHKSLGTIPDDPLPDRPPEDDIALSPAYFETLVALLVHAKDLPAVMMRIARLKEPRNWVNVLHVFSMRAKRVPEVLAFLEGRFTVKPTPLDTLVFEPGKSASSNGTVLQSPLDALDAHYLGCLAFAAYAQGSTNKALFEAIAARAAAIAALPESAHSNVSIALQHAGVALPSAVKAVKEVYDLKPLA